MDQRLEKLISDYHAKVSEAVAMLEAAGLHRPSSHIEWAFRSLGLATFPAGPATSGTVSDVTCPVLSAVDFDFGPRGEIDGMNPHRLHRVSGSRLAEYGLASVEEIEDTVQDALRTGDLVVSNEQIVPVSAKGCQR